MNSELGIGFNAVLIYLCCLEFSERQKDRLEAEKTDLRFKSHSRWRQVVGRSLKGFQMKDSENRWALLCGLLGFGLGCTWFKLMGVALAFGLMSWASYYKLNRLYRSWIKLQIQRELPQFFGILQGWSEINNNLIYCLEKVTESGLSPRLILPYSQCLREAKSGVPLDKALEKLNGRLETETQRHFVWCLMETTRRQGKLSDLFKGFESEASQIWLEIQRTSLLKLQYRLLIYFLFVAAGLLLYLLLQFNSGLGHFYLETTLGNRVLTGLSLLTALTYVREVHEAGEVQ